MRDFFIQSFEKLVAVIIVLMSLGVLFVAAAALFGNSAEGAPSGVLGALAVLIFGGVYIVFVGGLMYLGLGIYQNTKRMAEAMERQSPGA